MAGPRSPGGHAEQQVASPSITLGTSTNDAATLAGGTSPSGSLIFKLFGPGDPTCSAAPAYTSPLTTVTGDATYQSPSFVPTKAGTYSWVDLYSGDTHNAAQSTACGDPNETVTVSASTRHTDAVTLSFGTAPTYQSQSPVLPGTSTSFVATVNPNGVKTPDPGCRHRRERHVLRRRHRHRGRLALRVPGQRLRHRPDQQAHSRHP